MILSGDVVLVDEKGRHPMGTGDVAVFAKNDGNGHMLVNESAAEAILLAVSMPEASSVHYPDIDPIWTPEGGEQHVDGAPY